MARSSKIKVWPSPNGIKRPNENSQPSRGLVVTRAVSKGPGKGNAGKKPDS